jgi:hypothetical protein
LSGSKNCDGHFELLAKRFDHKGYCPGALPAALLR